MIDYLFIQRVRFQKRIEKALEREVVEGFTLLELLTVIAILGALATIAIPAYTDSIERARVTKAVTDIVTLQKDIMAYEIINEAYPETLDDIGRGDLLDPWGNPYQYLNFANAQGKGKMRKDRFLVPINTYFDLYSMGKDGKTSTPLTSKNSYDDIILANDGTYIGEASKY